MNRRPSLVRFACGHPDCSEFVRYEADNRAHSIELQKRYGSGQWKCIRHTSPNEVISEANMKTVEELTVFQEPHGLYWGKEKAWNGFSHGPGFKAFAEDFPVGTVLRITAEIVFPSKSDVPQGGKK